MRPLAEGSRQRLEFTVDEDMLARFDGVLVHPVLSTWSLVHQLERAARRLLESCLEAGELGAGCGVDVRHLAPARLADRVQVEVELLRQTPRSFVCRATAAAGGRRLAAGTVYQAVWPAEEMRERMAAPGT